MTDRLKLGEQLYRMLPEVYRTRDKKTGAGVESSGDESLARYLDAHGYLLDLIHSTFEQQLKDAVPESSQEWLLPYFAQLLATNIISPDSAGKHAEVKNTVAWRQRKGTLKCAEEIAEAIGQMEVEIQEGWKRVAMTPRIGMPLIPANAHDDTLNLDMNFPCEAIRHPGLPAAMVDLRQPSRAIEALGTNPAAKSSNFNGIRQTWQQMNRHGVPCFPDSFEDVSRRMVDMRTPENSNGRYHHKRLLVFAPPPSGFFGLAPLEILWAERNTPRYEHYFEEVSKGGNILIRNRTERIIEITDSKVELEAKSYRIEGINFQGELSVPDGGRLTLNHVEADKVTVDTFSTDTPVLTVCDCLFREISSGGLVKLDSCTVLEITSLPSLQALDSIFMNINGINVTGSIEYSRIPDDTPLSTDLEKIRIESHQVNEENEFGYDPITEEPSFIEGQSALAARAVLSPNAPESIYQGARDHGEMGYYHRGRESRPVHILGDPSFSLPDDGGYPLTDVIFDNNFTVNSGQLVLLRSAAPVLTVDTPLNNSGDVIPSLSATDCLFQSISVEYGLARLEYCTIMEKTICKHIQASDCIFVDKISGVKSWSKSLGVDSFVNCLRYSAVHSIDMTSLLTPMTNTTAQPAFNEFRFCSGSATPRKANYGEWGYGVPGPLTPKAVLFGAEDGGEMGAYHHQFHALKIEAMLEKMRQFLPVGIEPVLIHDERLRHVPPEILSITSPT